MDRILIVEDDAATAEAVAGEVRALACEPVIRGTLDDGLAEAAKGGFKVIVLDRMLPGGDGVEAIARLKAAGSEALILVLSALGVTLDADGGVEAITQNSPAARAGLAEGDRILALDGKALDRAALETAEITKPALLRVAGPGGAVRHVVVDPWGRAEGMRAIGGANVLDPAVVVF